MCFPHYQYIFLHFPPKKFSIIYFFQHSVRWHEEMQISKYMKEGNQISITQLQFPGISMYFPWLCIQNSNV